MYFLETGVYGPCARIHQIWHESNTLEKLSFRKLPLDLSVTVRARTLVIGPSNLLTWAREQHIPLDFGKTVLHL